MIRHTSVLLTAGAVIAILTVALARPKAARGVSDEPTPPTPTPTHKTQLSLRISRHETTPGDEVTLHHLVPSNQSRRVSSIEHRVRRLAIYHRDLRKMAYLDDSGASYAGAPEVFSGLARALRSSHGFEFDLVHGDNTGFEVRFATKRVGVYLITAAWSLRDSDEILESNPVLLVVTPKLDNERNPVLDVETLSGASADEQTEFEEYFDLERSRWKQ